MTLDSSKPKLSYGAVGGIYPYGALESGAELDDLSVNQGYQSSASANGDSKGLIRSVRFLGGDASVSSEIVNMSKNLIGCGVLSLSGGIAMYSNSPRALISASFWIVILGAIFGYFCLLIGKVCKITKSVTYRECWENSMGDKGALAVSFVYALKPAMASLALSTILSQTLQSLLKTGGIDVSRIETLLFVTVICILPLCLLKNLHVLAPFSALGTAGSIVTAVAMLIRYLDGSYQEGGLYFDDIPAALQPSFGDRNMSWSGSSLPYVCMLFEAYVMHYNSPRFYSELKDPTIPRFAIVVGTSFGFSAVINIIIASSGYLTFGGSCDGYILNNYSPQDPLATLSRLAIAVSTLLSYPIAFMGYRDGILVRNQIYLNSIARITYSLTAFSSLVFRMYWLCHRNGIPV
jgi:amino acid permease